MKELVFNKNSWHYRLAKWAGYSSYTHGADICAYMRRVMLGFFLIALTFTLIAFLAYCMVDLSFGVVFSILLGEWVTGAPGTITLIFVLVAVFIFSMAHLTDMAGTKYREWKYKDRPAKPDGFVTNAYNSWKGKYCAKIKFVDGNTNNSI